MKQVVLLCCSIPFHWESRLAFPVQGTGTLLANHLEARICKPDACQKRAMLFRQDCLLTYLFIYLSIKIWDASWDCLSFSYRGHANVCIIPILVSVLLMRAPQCCFLKHHLNLNSFSRLPSPQQLPVLPDQCPEIPASETQQAPFEDPLSSRLCQALWGGLGQMRQRRQVPPQRGVKGRRISRR